MACGTLVGQTLEYWPLWSCEGLKWDLIETDLTNWPCYHTSVSLLSQVTVCQNMDHKMMSTFNEMWTLKGKNIKRKRLKYLHGFVIQISSTCGLAFLNQMATFWNAVHQWLFTPQPCGLEGYCRHSPGGWVGVCQTCGTHISVTTWRIFSIRSSVELSRPVVVHCHGHLPICPTWACPWAQNLSNLPQIGSRLCGTHISETAGWIYPI